jgi:hypothetical protein
VKTLGGVHVWLTQKSRSDGIGRRLAQRPFSSTGGRESMLRGSTGRRHGHRRVRILAVLVAGTLSASVLAGCERRPAAEQQGQSPISSPPAAPSRLPAKGPSSSAAPSGLVENFDGSAGTAPDPTLFTPTESGNGNGNHELETYTSSRSNSALDGNGHLVITARHETVTGPDGYTRDWTSARLSSSDHWAFKYGLLEARIKLPVGQGLWPAFWLLGTDISTVGWPKCGEIDVLESLNDATTAHHALHGPTESGSAWGLVRGTRRSSASAAQYHVYSVERRVNRIAFMIDGSVVSVFTPKDLKNGQRWVFDKPMFVVLNVAVGGDWPKSPDATTPAVSSMSVDWMRFSP